MAKRLLGACIAAIAVAGCGVQHGAIGSLVPEPSRGGAPPRIVSPDLVSGNIIQTFIAPSPPPSGTRAMEAIAFGSDGDLWVVDAGGIDRVTPSGSFAQFAAFGLTATEQIISGPGGALWFPAENSSFKPGIGRLTTAGAMTVFVLPSGDCARTGIAKGPDGNVWYSDACTKRIGKMTPTGAVTEFALPAETGVPWGIIAGPDGKLWFTTTTASGTSTSYFGNVTTSGVVSTFTPPFSADMRNIVKGLDGDLYAGDENGQSLVRITTSGVASRFATHFTSSGPYGLAVGPDKQIWMTSIAGQIEEFNTTTHVMSPAAAMPDVGADTPSGNDGITLGPFGDMWFTSGTAHAFAQYVGRYEENVATVGVRLNGETSLLDPNYGFELGYAVGTGTQTQTISLFANESVQFKNLDASFPHTAAFLGNATSTSAPWPPAFNGGTTQSPAGTMIGTVGWTTGNLNPGSTSLLYSTGLPGFYMIGCQYHFGPDHMRTVIIVH